MPDRNTPPSLHIDPSERLSTRAPRTPKKTKAPRQKRGPSWIGFLVKWFVILAVWGLVALGAALVFFGHDLPDVKRLEMTTRRPSVTLLGYDGSVIATYGDLYGHFMSVKDLPPQIPQAIMATEDRRFYSHFGLDLWGIMRAFLANARAGRVVQGGSTLTQQLAKSFLISEKLYQPNDRSLRRKIQEVLMVLWLENHFSKDQIFSMYLNRVYLGAGVYGVEAAAQKYFGKTAKDLGVYEAAVIAGLLQAPSRYSPLSNPKLADLRARAVLQKMVEAGYLKPDAMKAIKPETEKMNQAHQQSQIGRYFSDWVFEILDEFIGKPSADIIVRTTLDPKLQKLAEEKALGVLQTDGPALNISQVGLVALSPDGAVRAMIGGKSYGESQFNRATQARRQTGSSFKYVVFLSALERGMTPEDRVSDTPVQIGKWAPKNYTWKQRGELSLQDAFAYSVNACAIRLTQDVGVGPVTKMALRLGITTVLPDNLSIALGTGGATLLELTAAYAVVANEGYGVWPYGITEIQDAHGEILYTRNSQGAGRVLEPSIVAQALPLMQAAFTYGTGKSANIGRPCAGKTGTSQNYRDAWAIGFTPELVTGVWVGNDNEDPMKKVTGGKIPAKIWKAFMSDALANKPIRDFQTGTRPEPSEHAPNIIDRIIESVEGDVGAIEQHEVQP